MMRCPLTLCSLDALLLVLALPSAGCAPALAQPARDAAAPDAAATLRAPPRALGKPWQQTSAGDDIVTFKREVPGSEIIALRDIARIDHSILRVASVLLYYTRAQEWID